MKVFNKSCCVVKPADQTMSGKLALSELDQTGFGLHVPTIYFYEQSPDNWVSALQALKRSLSYTLVNFYPLAGRLSSITRGRLEINCNDTGVEFMEAYADSSLKDMDSLSPSPIYHQLIPSVDYHKTPLEYIPLLVLQVTRFMCGGFSLGLSISYVATDGQGEFHFVSECRGEQIESLPFLDRKVLRARALTKLVMAMGLEMVLVYVDGSNLYFSNLKSIEYRPVIELD